MKINLDDLDAALKRKLGTREVKPFEKPKVDLKFPAPSSRVVVRSVVQAEEAAAKPKPLSEQERKELFAVEEPTTEEKLAALQKQVQDVENRFTRMLAVNGGGGGISKEEMLSWFQTQTAHFGVVTRLADAERALAETDMHAFFECDCTLGDIDLSSYKPTSGGPVVRIRFRKTDDTSNKLIFTDGLMTYNFVDQKGEFISLVWQRDADLINII